jgi:hypothetical protein
MRTENKPNPMVLSEAGTLFFTRKMALFALGIALALGGT